MIILLYLLLIAFILIEIPLLFLIVFLFRHRKEDGVDKELKSLRHIMLIVTTGKFLFILGEIVLVLSAIVAPLISRNTVVWVFSLSTLVLFTANWWGFFRIKRIL